MKVTTNFDDYWPGEIRMVGAAHAVSADPEPVNEAIRLLHQAVEEVTGKPVDPPFRPRMGFLP